MLLARTGLDVVLVERAWLPSEIAHSQVIRRAETA
jgi:hypothetical protein